MVNQSEKDAKAVDLAAKPTPFTVTKLRDKLKQIHFSRSEGPVDCPLRAGQSESTQSSVIPSDYGMRRAILPSPMTFVT